MNKVVKIIIIIIGVVFVGFIGRCAYMVLCISCTTPSIKTYDYTGSMDEFENNLKNFTISNPNVSYKISRRGQDVDDARDIIVETKTQAGNIRYDLVIYKFNETTKLDLSCAYNETNKTGGCSTKDRGVEELFNRFKNDFLVRLEKDQQIVLEPIFFNF